MTTYCWRPCDPRKLPIRLKLRRLPKRNKRIFEFLMRTEKKDWLIGLQRGSPPKKMGPFEGPNGIPRFFKRRNPKDEVMRRR